MQATQTIIIGVIAILIGVVLIGPVTSTVQGMTTQGVCATGSVTALDGTTSVTGGPDNRVVPIQVRFGSVRYEAGTLCADTQGNVPTTVNADVTADDDHLYAISGTNGMVAGALGFGNESSRALAILIPLLFVAAIMVIPMYLIWGKLKGNGSAMA